MRLLTRFVIRYFISRGQKSSAAFPCHLSKTLNSMQTRYSMPESNTGCEASKYIKHKLNVQGFPLENEVVPMHDKLIVISIQCITRQFLYQLNL